MTTVLKQSTFTELVDLHKHDPAWKEGIVLIGCGGDLMEWLTGTTRFIKDWPNLVKPEFTDTFDLTTVDSLVLTTTGGRTDLAIALNFDQVNVGVLAMWRLSFGDCSWVSDYIPNYHDHHGISASSDLFSFSWALADDEYDEEELPFTDDYDDQYDDDFEYDPDL